MTARYAIYYAPPTDSTLWHKACAWLGRDAATGRPLARPSLPDLEGLDLDALTADPRGYGFHATLKAPFELAAGRAESELLDRVEHFVLAQPAFTLPIALAVLGRFLAFRIVGASPEMDGLHGACMRAFEPLRAPLSPADIERRRKAALTPEQDARMQAWGYPYAFEDFRFHMTLTGSIGDDATRARLLTALQGHFAAETGPHLFDGIAVFRQADREAAFDLVQRFDFKAVALA